MALTDSLVAYWKLEEASGTRNDSHGTNHLTDNNTVTGNPGKLSNACQFTSANNEWLSIDSNANLQMGDIDFTLAAWVYLDATGGLQKGIITKDGSGGGKREYSLHYDAVNNRFLFEGFSATDVDQYIRSTTVLSATTWYYVVGWHDATNNKVYIQVNNGTPDEASTTAALQAASTAVVGIGGRSYSGSLTPFNGRIDSAAIWKRVLTADERTSLYNSGNGLEYPFSSSASFIPGIMRHHFIPSQLGGR